MQAVLQGSFIFAKAKQGPEVAAQCIAHLRRYLQMLFDRPDSEKSEKIVRNISFAERYQLNPADL
jgi:hypothetical protein